MMQTSWSVGVLIDLTQCASEAAWKHEWAALVWLALMSNVADDDDHDDDDEEDGNDDNATHSYRQLYLFKSKNLNVSFLMRS